MHACMRLYLGPVHANCDPLCSHEGSDVLPDLPGKGAVTKLDRKLKRYRENELVGLRQCSVPEIRLVIKGTIQYVVHALRPHIPLADPVTNMSILS